MQLFGDPAIQKAYVPSVLIALTEAPIPQAVTDDWRIKLAMPLFLLIDAALARPKLARYLFDKFRQPETLRTVLMVRWGPG